MARMSIDDKFLRDPRVLRFATDLAMNKFEIHGRLLAVFAVTYDLERDVLTPDQIDTAAEFPGFADAMFAADLAVTSRRGLRIRGARERIKYLGAKVEAGRIGGIKSGESRRKTAKQKRASNEARPNPPDPVPDPVPDPKIRDLPSARAIPDRGPAPVPAPAPALAPTTAPLLLDVLWGEFELERQRVASSLRIELLPLAVHDRGRHDLASALANARQAGKVDLEAKRVRLAIAVAGAEAEGAQDCQWLTGAVFTQDNLRRLSSTTPAKAKQAAGERRALAQRSAARANGSQPSITPPRRADPLPAPPPIAPENLAGAAELADAWKALGIAKEPA